MVSRSNRSPNYPSPNLHRFRPTTPVQTLDVFAHPGQAGSPAFSKLRPCQDRGRPFPSTTDRLERTDSLQVVRELSPLRSVTFPINSREPGLPVNISEILWRNPTNPSRQQMVPARVWPHENQAIGMTLVL
ncbi:hypothetical protein NW767_012371 [Fusarium falciforme]|nr:hypothetical protein NW767_012371 [Fusarium falciforme]